MKGTKRVLSLVLAVGLVLGGIAFNGVRANTTGALIAPPATAQAATLGQKNALAKAKSYLSIMAFSKSGLIKQLKYEGFTAKEAKYGAAHCGANWKKQAVKKAKEYLKLMAFSKSGLIKQLKYDGFTSAQAKYAAKKVGY
jgi:hypothetical protein